MRRSTLLPILALPLALWLACDSKEPQNSPPPKSPETAPTPQMPSRPSAPVLADPPVIEIPPTLPGTELARAGDEIMVAGRLFHTGTRVVLWTDAGGYDGYRVERRFAPWAEASWQDPTLAGTPLRRVLRQPPGQPDRPNRYGIRESVLNWPELEAVRGGGWPLALLQEKVDQFVLHFDAVGTSQACFRTLHDDRGLSVHFMLDVDGTIYQTLDVKERAYHATTSNHRSVGIEIANRGAYESETPLKEFYAQDAGGPRIALPARFGDGGFRVPGIYRPDRPALVRGKVNGLSLVQYDFTPQQYAALARLTATLCTALPKITLTYPRDPAGGAILNKLPDARLAAYQGLLAHSNIQDNKYDPGPAFQWDRLLRESRALMSREALEANRRAQNKPVRASPLATRPRDTLDREK